MKIIRTGGVNKYLTNQDVTYNKHGYGKYILIQLKKELDNIIGNKGKVIIVTSAQPNSDYYNSTIEQCGYTLSDLDIFGKDTVDVDWSKYTAIVLLGGSTHDLYNWLHKTNFSLDVITNCSLLAGDSAGAYVLGKYSMVENEPDGSVFEIKPGLIDKGDLLVAGHVNNPRYHQAGIRFKLEDYAKEHNAQLLLLEENELHSEQI